ncbi:MAG: hypothetical protein AW07_00843 [Candidatus Accumulibacter sp. SK-11]|nr:MAG: hypothetical protein AW07_00843 [Candidatus Accumulibacter sp. SK-11]
MAGFGSGEDLWIARSTAASRAGLPLERRNLTSSTSPLGSWVTSNSACGFPWMLGGSVMLPRILPRIFSMYSACPRFASAAACSACNCLS